MRIYKWHIFMFWMNITGGMRFLLTDRNNDNIHNFWLVMNNHLNTFINKFLFTLNSTRNKYNISWLSKAEWRQEGETTSYLRPSLDVCNVGETRIAFPYTFFPSPPLVKPIFLNNREPIHVVCFLNLGETKTLVDNKGCDGIDTFTYLKPGVKQ